MSARGTNFLHHWLENNLPGMFGSDVVSVSEAIQKLFADAKAVGISSNEIEDDTGSVYEAVFDAVVHYQGGQAG